MINQPHMVFFGHPWSGGLQWKLDALRYRQMNTFISVARDRDTGRVYPHPDDGRPVIDYTPSAFDRAHILAGQVAIAKLCFIQGATEIWPFVHGVPPFVRRRKPGPNSATASAAAGEEGNNNTPNPNNNNKNTNSDDNDEEEEDDEEKIDQGVNDADFAAWLRVLEKADNRPPSTGFSCAHQMGTSRMSARAADGVVDPRGRVWGVGGLYVADASVFPSASGVNPMITVMAIADWIARGVDRELRRKGT